MVLPLVARFKLLRFFLERWVMTDLIRCIVVSALMVASLDVV